MKAGKAVRKLNFSSNGAILSVFSRYSVKLKQYLKFHISYMCMVECPPNIGYLLLTVKLYIY